MKTLTSALLLSATLISGSAFAASRAPSGELDYPPAASQTSQLTRAQVLAELQQAKADNEIPFAEGAAPVAIATSTVAPVIEASGDDTGRSVLASSGADYPETGA